MSENTEPIAINDFLGKPPGWLLRSGIMVVFAVIIGILALSSVIRYPDKLSGAAIIQHEQTSINITPRISAILDTIIVDDNDSVKINQIIGILRSEADWRQILSLDTLISNSKLESESLPEFDQLGNLQLAYADWVLVKNEYYHFLRTSSLKAELKGVAQEIAHTNDLITNTNDQLALLDHQINIETRDYQRQSSLAKENLVSLSELEMREKALLAIQERQTLLKSSIIQYKLRRDQLIQQSSTMERSYDNKLFEIEQSYTKLVENLKGKIHIWKEQFLIQSPSNGYVLLNKQIVEKQLVNIGDVLFSIQPLQANETPLIVRIQIPVQGIGKITKGDDIIVSLDAYPEQEFGVLTTKIERISTFQHISNEGKAFYFIEGLLPEPLVTNFGKEVLLNLTTSGTGTIITKNRSILSRIFSQILSLIKQTR